MSLELDLVAIERQLWMGGPETYEKHTDRRCLVVFAEMTQVMSREDVAKAAQKGRWRNISIEPKGMVALSDASAIVSYECRAERQDGHPYHALVSSAYVKRPDGWKLAFHQQTPIG